MSFIYRGFSDIVCVNRSNVVRFTNTSFAWYSSLYVNKHQAVVNLPTKCVQSTADLHLVTLTKLHKTHAKITENVKMATKRGKKLPVIQLSHCSGLSPIDALTPPLFIH